MPVWEYEHPVATVVIPLKDYDQLREELAALKRSVGETKQALDAERAQREVWAVVDLDYEDYQVGAPRSYHWTEASARAAMHRHRPARMAGKLSVVQIPLDGDLPDEEATR